MANNTTGNPIYFDATSGASWTGTKYVRLFQWIDDAQDIATADTCVFTVNGVTLTAKVNVEVTANHGITGAAVWTIGPFNPGVPWSDFVLTTATHGAVHIWVD